MINLKMDHSNITVTVDCKSDDGYTVNNREFLLALDKLLKCVDSYESIDIRIFSNDSSDTAEESDYDYLVENQYDDETKV